MCSFRRCISRIFLAVSFCASLAAQAPGQQLPPDGAEPTFRGKTLSQWIEMLEEWEDHGFAIEAAYALQQLGPAAKPAVPVLTDSLQSRDDSFRATSARALGAIGPAAVEAVPALVKLLDDRSDETRLAALDALAAIGSGDATQAVFGTLKSKDVRLRRGGANVVGRMERRAKDPIPALLAALEDDDSLVRVEAAAALWRIEEHPAAIPALAAALQGGLANAQWAAARKLEAIGPPAKAAAGALAAALRGENRVHYETPRFAVAALERLGSAAEPAVAELVLSLGWESQRLLRDEAKELEALDELNAPTALLAGNVLVRIGAPAVAALAGALEHKRRDVRIAAVHTLGRMGRAAKPAARAMARLLKDEDFLVRAAVARSLGQMEDGARESATDLVPLLDDKNADLCALAAEALWKIQRHDRAVPTLRRALEAKDYRTRIRAGQALWRVAKDDVALRALVEALADARERREHFQFYEEPTLVSGLRTILDIGERGVPTLVAALKHDRVGMRQVAAALLARLGAKAKEAAPQLAAALQDEDRWVQYDAAQALAEIGPAAKAVLPQLLSALRDEFRRSRANDVRREFLGHTAPARLLSKIGRGTKDIVPPLLAMLDEADEFQRRAVLKILGDLGGTADQATPAILKVLRNKDQETRRAALEALTNIGREAPHTMAAVAAVLREKDDDLRQRVMTVCYWVGPAAKAATPALAELLTHENPSIANYAATVLERIGPGAEEAVPALVRALRRQKDANQYDLRQVPAALVAIGRVAEPELMVALSDDNVLVRYVAAETLMQIKARSQRANEALLQLWLLLIEDRDPARRARAALWLREFPTAAGVVPALAKALEDENHSVVYSAVESLRKLGPAALPAAPALTKALSRRVESAAGALAGFGLAGLAEATKLYFLDAARAEEYLPNLVYAIGRKRSMRWLQAALTDKDPEIRLAAALTLSDQRVENSLKVPATLRQATLPVLVQGIPDTRASVRALTLARLVRLEASDKPDVVLVAEAMHDDDQAVRKAAADLLIALGPKAAAAVPVLTPRIVDARGDVDPLAIAVLLRTQAADTQFGAALDRAHDVRRLQRLMEALGNNGSHSVGVLTRALDHGYVAVRQSAAMTLRGLMRIEEYAAARVEGRARGQIIAGLMHALGDEDAAVREAAVDALLACPERQVVEKEAVALLGDRDAVVREMAARVLAKHRGPPRDAVPALAALVRDVEHTQVAIWATYALMNLRESAKETVPALIDAAKMRRPFTDELSIAQDQVRRQVAAGALGIMGVAAKAAIPALIAMVREEDTLNYNAIYALAKIGRGDREVLDVLLAAGESRSIGKRRVVVQSLDNWGVDAKPAVPAMIRLLKDPDDSVAGGAARVLGSVGKDAQAALPALIETLGSRQWKDESDSVHINALTALSKLGLPSKTTTPILLKIIKDPKHKGISISAGWILQDTDPAAWKKLQSERPPPPKDTSPKAIRYGRSQLLAFA